MSDPEVEALEEAARRTVRRLSSEVVEAYPTLETLAVLRSLVRSHLPASFSSVLPEDERDALIDHSVRTALTVRSLTTT